MAHLALLAALSWLAAPPAGAAVHKLTVRLADGGLVVARTLTAEELALAESPAAARPLRASAVVSREADGVHLIEYQVAYDDRETRRSFNAQGAVTLARGERLRVIACGDYVVDLALDAKAGSGDWPAGDDQNVRLTSEFERAGRKRTCRTVTRLGTQLNLDMSSGPKDRATTLRYAHVLSGAKSKPGLEFDFEDVLAGGAKLAVQKTETLPAGSWAERDGEGYKLSWLAEAPPKKVPRAAAPKAAPAAPKPVKPVPRPRLQSSGGIGFGATTGGGGGGAPALQVAPTIPIPQLPAAKPQGEEEEEASQ